MTSPAASDGYNPFSTWQCPHCQNSFCAKDKKVETATKISADDDFNFNGSSVAVLFLRGTCHHDVCIRCITTLSSLVSKRVKREGVIGDEQRPIIVTVTCPIIIDHGNRRCSGGRSCNGLFHVDISTIHTKNSAINNMVIDLCDDDEGEEPVIATAVATVTVKRENAEVQLLQQHPCGGRGIASINVEDIQPGHVFSTHLAISSSSSLANQPSSKPDTPFVSTPHPIPLKEETTHLNLKPLFEVGDDVYAAWWDPKTDKWRKKKSVWYPGKVISYQTIEDTDATSKYGPSRLYHVMYDDGDELDNLEDYYVFSRRDYELTMKFKEMGWHYIGVGRRFDKTSSDKWARIVGWYEITGDGGEVQSFSTLSDAMKAHDAFVVRKNGAETKRSALNIPEEYGKLFGSTTVEAPEVRAEEVERVDAKSIVQIRTNVVSPESGSIFRIKSDPTGDDDDTVFHGQNNAERTHEWQELKRRRLDPTLEAKLQSTAFWSENRELCQFTEQAFMNKAIFHLNSFIRSKGTMKVNQAFSEFIREGVATPGFDRFPITLGIENITNWTCSELREVLVRHGPHDGSGATQTAMWLKNATVGSFVIMRHEYPKCPFCPKRLFVDGKYIGPVYVIGIITKKVLPWSEEEWDIENNKMGDFSRGRYPIHSVCRISWIRMGLKKSLDKSTLSYIGQVVQPTLAQICKDPGKVYAGGGTSGSIRRDLWMNATIPISSDEFPDRFIHEGTAREEEDLYFLRNQSEIVSNRIS